MTVSTTKLYKILSSQMNAETAETLTDFIEQKVKEDVDSRTEIFLTKDDKIDIIDRINKAEKNVISRIYMVVGIAIGIIGLLIRFLGHS